MISRYFSNVAESHKLAATSLKFSFESSVSLICPLYIVITYKFNLGTNFTVLKGIFFKSYGQNIHKYMGNWPYWKIWLVVFSLFGEYFGFFMLFNRWMLFKPITNVVLSHLKVNSAHLGAINKKIQQISKIVD